MSGPFLDGVSTSPEGCGSVRRSACHATRYAGDRTACLAFQQPEEIGAVTRLEQGVRACGQLVVVYETHPPGHLLGDADLQPLAAFDGAHIVARVEQRVEGAGVQPRGAAGHHLYREPARV